MPVTVLFYVWDQYATITTQCEKCNMNVLIVLEQKGRRPPANIQTHEHTHSQFCPIAFLKVEGDKTVLGRFHREATERESWGMIRQGSEKYSAYFTKEYLSQFGSVVKNGSYDIRCFLRRFQQPLMRFSLFVLICVVPSTSHMPDAQ